MTIIYNSTKKHLHNMMQGTLWQMPIHKQTTPAPTKTCKFKLEKKEKLGLINHEKSFSLSESQFYIVKWGQK